MRSRVAQPPDPGGSIWRPLTRRDRDDGGALQAQFDGDHDRELARAGHRAWVPQLGRGTFYAPAESS